MPVILVATALATAAVPGCSRPDRAVVCRLAPPIAPRPPAAPVRAIVRPAPRKRHDTRPRRPAGPPDAAAVARHVRSLVDIADCTGARTYLAAAATPAIAAATFDACIAAPGRAHR